MTTYRFVACWNCDDGGQWTSQSFCCWTPAPCTLLSGRNDCVPPELADRRIFSKWLGLLMPWNEWLALFQMTGWLLSQHTYSWQRRRHFVQRQRSFVIKRGGGNRRCRFSLGLREAERKACFLQVKATVGLWSEAGQLRFQRRFSFWFSPNSTISGEEQLLVGRFSHF